MQNRDDKLIKKEIGKLVLKQRKSLNLSQEVLAAEIGIKVRTLSKIENGHAMFSAKTLCKLCDYFDLPPKAFFDFEEYENIDENKLNIIIEKLRAGGDEKINFYFDLITLVERKFSNKLK